MIWIYFAFIHLILLFYMREEKNTDNPHIYTEYNMHPISLIPIPEISEDTDSYIYAPTNCTNAIKKLHEEILAFFKRYKDRDLFFASLCVLFSVAIFVYRTCLYGMIRSLGYYNLAEEEGQDKLLILVYFLDFLSFIICLTLIFMSRLLKFFSYTVKYIFPFVYFFMYIILMYIPFFDIENRVDKKTIFYVILRTILFYLNYFTVIQWINNAFINSMLFSFLLLCVSGAVHSFISVFPYFENVEIISSIQNETFILGGKKSSKSLFSKKITLTEEEKEVINTNNLLLDKFNFCLLSCIYILFIWILWSRKYNQTLRRRQHMPETDKNFLKNISMFISYQLLYAILLTGIIVSIFCFYQEKMTVK